MKEEVLHFSQSDTTGPLQIQSCGVSWCDGNYRIARPPQKIYVFEFVEKGTGTLRVGDRIFHPHTGDVYVAPAWIRHKYFSSKKDPWVKYWFNLAGEMPETMLRIYHLDETYLYPEAWEAGELIKKTIQELRNLQTFNVSDCLEPFFFELIRLLSRKLQQEQKSETDPRTEKMLLFMRQHIMKAMPTLEEIAESGRVSVPQAMRFVRKETGFTPCQWLLNHKIDVARDLLLNSGFTVKEIAYRLGFRDEFYFSRIFRNKCGISPALYRKKTSNQDGFLNRDLTFDGR